MKSIAFYIIYLSSLLGTELDLQYDIAGGNRIEIKKAIKMVPEKQSLGMVYLIEHMSEDDLQTLSSSFLLNNCNLAYKAWEDSPWYTDISEKLFFDYILPYASLNENREEWRKELKQKSIPIIKNANSISEAVVLLNQNIFKEVGVIYSTERPKADQSPSESIKAGKASCTGLSILLIDACRSVGIPARFVGTSSWYNNSGNHSWIEIWDNGWHYTGAAEPTGNNLDEVWFAEHASKATSGDMKYGIFAATWGKTDTYFPMDWLPGIKKYNSIDVTDKYKKSLLNKELIPISLRVLGPLGQRKAVRVIVENENEVIFEGKSKNESCDLNDHLIVLLQKGKTFTFKTEYSKEKLLIQNEQIVDLGIKLKSKK